MGNLGDIKTLGNGISEMRIDVGSGYRIYFTLRGKVIVILLVGGDKSSQDTDIRRAKKLVKTPLQNHLKIMTICLLT